MSVLLPVIFTLLNIALFPIFILSIRRSPLWFFIIFFLVIVAESIFVSFYTLINFEGAFGPGVLAFCASALIVPFMIVAWIVFGVRLFPQLDSTRRKVYGIGGLLILLAQAAPLIGNYGIGGYCDAKARDYGNEVMQAVQRYQKDHGIYPTEIVSLIPDYLPAAPAHHCMSGLGLNYDSFVAEYEIKQCRGKPSLATQSTDGSKDIWHDFETGEWSSMSFFDSGCY